MGKNTHPPQSPSGVFRRFRARAGMFAMALLLVPLPAMVGAPAANAAPAKSLTPFATGSPFRTPLLNTPTLDPNSRAMAASMSRDNSLYSNLVEFGIPIYHATPTTPRYAIRCTMPWGPCPFDGYRVPIPTDAKPSPGSDGAMVVIDPSTRRTFEFWQARRAGDQWTTSWGGVADLDGDGWKQMHGNSTGSGASRLGGVIRVSEIQQNEIPHALALQSNNVCANEFRSPATKTDGTSTRSDCIPEGAKVRLDPAVNLDSLNLTPAARTVARAMQTYGGYVMDVGGAPLSVSFELDTTAVNGSIGRTYKKAGLRWDYDSLRGVPWDRLQVLAHSADRTPPAADHTPRRADRRCKSADRWDRRDASERRARWSR